MIKKNEEKSEKEQMQYQLQRKEIRQFDRPVSSVCKINNLKLLKNDCEKSLSVKTEVRELCDSKDLKKHIFVKRFG